MKPRWFLIPTILILILACGAPQESLSTRPRKTPTPTPTPVVMMTLNPSGWVVTSGCATMVPGHDGGYAIQLGCTPSP